MIIRGLYILISLLCTGGFIWWNYYQIVKKNKNINHNQQVWIRVPVYIGLIIASIIRQDNQVFLIISYLGFDFFSFGTFFPTILNLLRHLDIGYTGKNDNTDKVLTWIFNRCPPVFFYFCTLLIAATFGYTFVVGYNTYYNLMHGIYNY